VEEKAKSGGTIFISTAAGSVGSFVVQLAKKAGLKVIGSTGSDEKVAFLKSLGVDITINYKTDDLASILAKEGPIDIYWDNVGGDHLNIALENMAFGGIVVICGLASGYNSGEGHLPVKDISRVLFKGLSVYGHLTMQYETVYAEEFYEKIPWLIANGSIQQREQLYRGLEKAPQALHDLLKGDNTGKVVVVLRDE